MRNYLLYDGRDSRDFEVYISGGGTYNSPEREYTFISIPGKSGDLVIDKKRLKNVPLTYPAFVFKDMKGNIELYKNFLLSRRGYKRLEDTYHPDEFRLAVFKDAMNVSTDASHTVCTFDLKFECKPQRFLKSGEFPITFTSSSYIHNPTGLEAKPLLRIYGTGNAVIGDTTVTISQADVYTDIDCELMVAYKGSTPKNSNVSMSTIDYPVLGEGTVPIGLGTGISKIEVIPRWYRV